MQRRTFLVESGRAALGFGALASASCVSRPQNAAKDAFLESLAGHWAAAIPGWLSETKMPAVSIAIVRDGQLAWRRAFGVKDTGTNEAVDNDSVFAACSDTKPVFAYGVLKLCEKGALNLDTPLTNYTSRRVTTDPRPSSLQSGTCSVTPLGFRIGDRRRISRFSSRRARSIILRRRVQLSAGGCRGDHRQVV